MASDLSSGCTEAIGVLDEKEEGEISLEDVSSSEEGHLNYGYGIRGPQCTHCLSTQHCTAWCPAPAKLYHSRSQIKKDAVQGKENRHHIKESGYTGTKHTVSTLQEKNDDLVPISSDSDMEIVGLADNTKQIRISSSSKGRTKKKRKKKRSHASVFTIDDLVSVSNEVLPETVSGLKHVDVAAKSSSISRSHHRDVSPVHRSSRSRLCPRSPPRRHRSPIKARSPFKKSQSPVMRARSPVMRKSPRRVKSPKASSFLPSGHVPKKVSHLDLSPNSENYTKTHKLLKKVRRLDSMGNHSLETTLSKHKEHASSLKEKLTIMMKGVSDNNGNVTNYKGKSNARAIQLNDADDEEDLALLRQKALETKQKGLNKRNDQPKTETAKEVIPNPNDDEDEEDLELRMIALRSAVMKKHKNRLEKGMKSGKYKKAASSRSESPFTQSFLDSIPIPGEELLNFASPPHTPPPLNENNHTEDMELDTDVEREKEKLPYSPTDKITANIPMDTELLGIQPSDVSFISLNEANNSPVFSTASIKVDQKSLQEKIIENRSYLPNVMYYPPSENSFETTNADLPYSPTDSIGSSRPDIIKKHNSHVPMHHYLDAGNMLKNDAVQNFPEINSNPEMPYSPTDTPMYDPDLSLILPQTPGPIATSNSPLLSLVSLYNCSVHENLEQYDHVSGNSQSQIVKQSSNISNDKSLEKAETFSIDGAVGSATTSLAASASPASSMITIDDLPDTDVDASPLTESVQCTKSMEYIPDSLSDNVKEATSEPHYMKGVPDVTKDVNKIPTLINRTLVPAPILKTNKQLQQPLPARKQEVHHPEPTFKSAEMQPVAINEETSARTNTLFKPMKLMPIVQKSHSILITPTAFHDSSIKDSPSEATVNKNTSSLENKNNSPTWVQNTKFKELQSPKKTCDITTSTQKKKKYGKKGGRRKSVSTTGNKSHSVSSINKDNTAEHIRTKKNEGKRDARKSIINNMNNPTEPKKTSSKRSTGEKEAKETAHVEIIEQKSIDNRRQSLDDDEEALRAILLASLPKRAKLSDSSPSSSIRSTTSTLSNTATTQNNQAPLIQAVQNTAETVNVTPSIVTQPLSHQPANTDLSEGDKNQHGSETKTNNASTKTDLSSGKEETSVPSVSARKRPIPIAKGPQKKIMKKNTIPASTKVVNNAKKYQNAIVQKRLNLQKVAMLYTNQKITETKSASKAQHNKNKWSTNTKTSLSSDTQRIVINLESDTESDSESEQYKNKAVSSSPGCTKTEKPAVINSKAEFEKNLDQFLRDVRKQQESVAAARPTVSTSQAEKTNPANVHTPLAVRHLPASQQEEYRRLKQQILEREKLKLRKTIESNTSPKNKPVGLSPKSAPSNQIKSNSSEKELHSSGNQSTSPKSQIISAQQLNKENKTVDSTKSPATDGDKTSNVDIQGSVNSFQTKTMPKTMTNLSIRVSNENVVSPNTIRNRIIGTPLSLVNASRTVFENITPTQEVVLQTKTLSGLKILSKDEVNRKFVQIQVKQDTNERVVTINTKVDVEEKVVADEVEKTTGEQSTDVTDSCDINNLLQIMEKEIAGSNTVPMNNEVVDSDASTIILPRENQNTSRTESFDSGESTILLSQYQQDKGSKDDSNSTLSTNNTTLDSKTSIEENWEPIKRDTKTELSALINLPQEEQERHLIETEQKLVTKRYTVLDELTEMSGSLCQWHMERDLQTNLAAEVRKLREQLKIAEDRLQLQRDRINSIGPKVVAAHSRINAGRQECFKLSRICSVLGTKIIGKQYKVPEPGAQLLDTRLKEVANHTRRLSRKKVPSIDISEVYISSKSDQKTTESGTCTKSTSRKENLSFSESMLDDNETTIFTESERTTESYQPEETSQLESITTNSNETSEVEENDNDRSIFAQQNTTIISKQPESSSTPIATIHSHDTEREQLSENMGPSTSSMSSNKNRNLLRINTELQTKKTVVTPYVSILTHFKVPRNTNPNGVLCPYELMGTCNDGDCQFVHQSKSEAK